ncbi:sulfur carrier protein ThiS [Phytoactinopolyspora endophytica]|uniref:sulfur carrier protein ThiS n=1 Tax=Phytoactinopolyspora endophytica TaxID=1642495 RepID=UPI00197B3FCC|nr:sulfur carrier protein ThiS [Phytoactinopolyspora endophytica]
MTTRIRVNGEEIAFDGDPSVHDVVSRTVDGIEGVSGGRGIAVALNDDVVPRSSWAMTTVNTGDQVEILTATQGG